MPSLERESHKIVIAGAGSLLGAEVKSLLEESVFASWDVRLVDEETTAGRLTEVGGEAAVIQPVEEDTFAGARLLFFTGSAEFTMANLKLALESKAKVIDLSGMRVEGSLPWFSQLEGKEVHLSKAEKVFSVLSAPAVCSALLSMALKPLGLKKLSIMLLRPVSDSGREGIEELQGQTSKLLSFQPVDKTVFDAQVAYAVLDRFGSESKQSLQKELENIRWQVRQAIAGNEVMPSLTMVHAPVFAGTSFSAYVEIGDKGSEESVSKACADAGFDVAAADEPVGNLTAVESQRIALARPQQDPAKPGSWWLWGAADNVRLPAWNAIKLAEKLLP